MAIKETIPFNFIELYAYVAKKFTDKGYDYQEGSNTMQLVTAMAYLTSMLNANTAVNINETLLTLARKRHMVLRDARILGYEIAHTQSYQYDVKVRLTNDTAVSETRAINKYTPFEAGDYKYWYLGDTLEIEIPANDHVDVTLRLVEGELHKFEDEPETLKIVIGQVYDSAKGKWYNQNYVDLPYTSVEDTHGIEVFLTYYDEGATFYEQEKWTRSTQFMIDSDTVLNKEYVRLDNIEYGTPRIYFKLGDVGKEIRAGTIVQMNVLKSNATKGAMTEMPKPVGLDAEVLSYDLVISGAEEESIESVKKNAPMFHNSANRAVTRPDYIAFINRQPAVRYSEVWDGNREFPRTPGHIWFSFIPKTMSRTIDDSAKPGYIWKLQNTYDELYANYFVEDDEVKDVFKLLDNYKIPTLIFHHRQPVYVDFDYNVKIARYVVKTSKADINTGVFNVINDYFRSEVSPTIADTDEIAVETFGFEYFQSNLVKRIDRNLTDIMGFDVKLKTSITLFEKHIIEEFINGDGAELKFHLGMPYEGLFDNNQNIIIDNIPDISTDNAIVDYALGAKRIYIDKNPDNIQFNADERISTLPIRLTDWDGVERDDDEVVGKYSIFNKDYQDIEVTLFVKSGFGALKEYTSAYTSGIAPENLRMNKTDDVIDEAISGLTLDLKYPSNNIAFTRNTIPRLKSVQFI